jgi:hypothetical protein
VPPTRPRQRQNALALPRILRLASELLPWTSTSQLNERPQRKDHGEAQMNHRDFYQEKKWCGACQSYVRYLMSVNHSYCVQCGTTVVLFSKHDSQRFNADLQKRKWRAS